MRLPDIIVYVILVVSRFRVANHMEEEVAEAFIRRPRLVEGAPGFLGLETFRDSKERSRFYLVTRWTDAASFRRWHGSPAHKESHRGIPKGLKLDAADTEVMTLERIAPSGSSPRLEELAADATLLLEELLERSAALHCLVTDAHGAVRFANAAAARAVGLEADALVGRCLWPLLVDPDAEALRALLAEGGAAPLRRRLNLVDARGRPRTLECVVQPRPDGLVLLGEPAASAERQLEEELLAANNELATLTRELTRRTKQLEAARRKQAEILDELRTSYWHIRKIAEVLPICMRCQKVKTATARWEELKDYLAAHTDFLSHSLCPDCLEREEAEWGVTGET